MSSLWKADSFGSLLIFFSVVTTHDFVWLHSWNLQHQTHFSSSAIGTIFRVRHNVSERERIFIMCAQSRASFRILDRQAVTTVPHTSGYEKLESARVKAKIRRLAWEHLQSMATQCVWERLRTVLTPSKMVSQRDMREVSFFHHPLWMQTQTVPPHPPKQKG